MITKSWLLCLIYDFVKQITTRVCSTGYSFLIYHQTVIDKWYVSCLLESFACGLFSSLILNENWPIHKQEML